MGELRDLCFLDCETTGLDPREHKIIELAMVRLDPRTLEVKSTLHQRFFPLQSVSPEIAAINGYSSEEWAKTARFFDDGIIATISDLLLNATPAGQNPGFDMGFLEETFRRNSHVLPAMDYHRLDVASLAWPLFVSGKIPGVGLRHTRKFFGLTGQQHRAMSDVLDTIDVYKKLMALYVGG